jgi:hypothetical protein
LARKPMAPAPSACARTLISEKAVTKMIVNRVRGFASQEQQA